MKKDIYIIKNSVNNKVYIGQAQDAAKRWLQHVYDTRYERKIGNHRQLIHKAMGKYGIEKFHYELLEHQIENYDERERYWISYYNSIVPNGYNIAPGGQGQGCGIESARALIRDKKTLLKIISEISSSNKTFYNIAKKYGCGSEVITAINNGQRYKLDGFKYPLRRTRYSNALVKQIRYSLKYELQLTLADIAHKYNVDQTQVSEINQGHIYYVDGEYYPLREKRYKDLDTNIVHGILFDIANSKLSMTEIAKKYFIRQSTLSGINSGIIYKQDNIEYPVRFESDSRNNCRKKFLSIEDINDIHTLLKTDMSVRDIAQKYDISTTMIHNINNGVTKKYVLPNVSYPIRKFNRRQQPVSTICA